MIDSQDWFYGDAINAKNCEKCTCDPQVGDLKDFEEKRLQNKSDHVHKFDLKATSLLFNSGNGAV